MKALFRALVLAAAACALCSSALAQQRPGRADGPPEHKGQPQYYRQAPYSGGMSSEQRERLRQEVTSARRGVYRDSGPPPGYDPRRAPQRPMAPEERDRLRRDIQDANRAFERRR